MASNEDKDGLTLREIRSVEMHAFGIMFIVTGIFIFVASVFPIPGILLAATCAALVVLGGGFMCFSYQ